MSAKTELFADTSPGQSPVRGFLHHASNSAGDFIVLTHGAGGNSNGPLLVALGNTLAESGLNVLRCDLPFRQRRPTGPPSPSDAKHDQEGLRRAVALMKERNSGRAFLGGSSYGGRQATMLAASDSSIADGLCLLSYPLHPPGRPAQLRTDHFPSLRVPSIFISGTKDAFGSVEELSSAIRLIPAPTKLVPIEGAGHGLSRKSNREEIPNLIAAEIRSFFH